MGVGVAAVDAAAADPQPGPGHHRLHVVRRQELDGGAGGDAGHPGGRQLLAHGEAVLPAGPAVDLLDDEPPARRDGSGGLRQQPAPGVGAEEVQHVDDHDGRPLAGGLPVEGDPAEHDVADALRGALGIGELAAVDVHAVHLPAGRPQGEVEREQAVSAADLEHPALGGHERFERGERAGQPAHGDVQAGAERDPRRP